MAPFAQRFRRSIFFFIFLFLFYLLTSRDVGIRGDAAGFATNAENLWHWLARDGAEVFWNRTPPIVTLYHLAVLVPRKTLTGLAATLAANAVPAAVGALTGLYALKLYRLVFGWGSAATLALVVGICSPLWIYAVDFNSEILQAWLLTAFFYHWLADKLKSSPRSKHLLYAGVFLGLLMLSKPIYLLLAPIFVVVEGLDRRKTQQAWLPFVWAVLAVGALGSVYLLYNRSVHGGFTNFGYLNRIDRDNVFGFNTPLWVSLYAFTLGIDKNFFLYCLPTLFVLAARLFWRLPGNLAYRALTVVVPIVVLIGSWWSYHGDWHWGPRLLVPLYPLVLLLAGFGMRRFVGKHVRARRLVVGAAILLSGLIQAPAVLISPEAMPFEIATSTSANLPPYGEDFHGQPFSVRDDQLMKHFVPEFNSISGQSWLVARKIFPGLPAPWSSLENPHWVAADNYWHIEWWVEAVLRDAGWVDSDTVIIIAFYLLLLAALVAYGELFVRGALPGDEAAALNSS